MLEIRLAARMAQLQGSATLALNARVKQLASEGKNIYNLTAGELATDTPDYIQMAVAKKLADNKYTPVAGLPDLRAKLAAHARTYYGLDWIEAGNVVVTGGAKPALAASLFALLDTHDEVIVPVPAWTTTYRPLIELAQGTMIEVPLTENFDLDVKAIAARLSPRTKAIIINSPQNPTGSVYSLATLKQLAGLLKNKSVTVISDDIYAQLVYDSAFRPPATCNFERIIIVSSFSKSQALTGWRIGYLIADNATAQAATSLLSHLTGNAPVPSQHAALAALGHHDKPPQSTLQDLKRRRQLVCEILDTIPGLEYHRPGGAFYVFIDVRRLTDNSAGWCEQLLLATGVALVPGEAFSAPGFARLSFTADDSVLEAALQHIKRFVTQGAGQ